jgi:hypothetical protein
LNRAYFRFQRSEFASIYGSHEVLFQQELEKRGKASMTPFAAKVREMGRVLYVVRQHQSRLATRTIEKLGQRISLRRLLLVQRREYAQDPARRELQAFRRVKPDHLAAEAEIERDYAALHAFEFHRLHRRGTARAIHEAAIRRVLAAYRLQGWAASKCACSFSGPCI